MEWMLMPYKRYAQFSGRSRRKEYWMFALFVTIVYIILATLMMTVSTIFYFVYIIFMLGSIVPGIACAVRRMHDVDKSGWFALIPIYNLILAVSEGTKGPNRFGPDPKDPASVEAFS